jgi:6-phosphogluconate dehydrogenase
MSMQLGMIGLGKTGANRTERLFKGGHRAVAYDRGRKPVQAIAASGATASGSIADLAARLSGPRAALRMVPAGQPTEALVNRLAEIIVPKDITIDGGNGIARAPYAGPLSSNTGHALRGRGHELGIWRVTDAYGIMVGCHFPRRNVSPSWHTEGAKLLIHLQSMDCSRN